jgi:peptide/nickel transport system substrate-binding protein
VRGSSFRRLVAFIGVLAIVAAACGDSKGSSSATTAGASATTAAGPTTTAKLTPVKGGVLVFGQFSKEGGLDPATLAGGGTVGGNENAAIYDTMMGLDHSTGKYIPRTAESMTPNADFTQWTTKIRAGIKFTDGTDYNADAVKFTLDREMKDGNAAVKGQLTNFIDTITVVDPLTISFKLKIGWAGFPYLFTHVPGMIYSPTQFKKVGDPKVFAVNPGDAGAGPFKVKSYKPGESVELERNPNYWGGDVYLDGMKFVLLATESARYDALKVGTLNAALFRDPAIYAKSKTDGFSTVDIPQIAGNLMIMNSGIDITCTAPTSASIPACAGQPDGTKVQTKTATRDPNVRKAIAEAIDPKIVVDRAYQGAGIPGSSPFVNFQWDPKVPSTKVDVADAKRLVTAAKAAGWDGKLRLIGGNDATSTAWVQAIKPQLEAVGMEVLASNDTDINGVVSKVLTQRDFDAATWGLGLSDESDANYTQLLGSFGSATKRYGYSSPDMDAAIEALRVADTDAKKIAAYKKISEIWLRDNPALVITYIPSAVIMSPKVHGIDRTGQSMTLFDKTWMEK